MKIAPAKLFAGRGNVIMLHSLHTFITLFTHIYSYLYKNVMYLNNTNYNKKHSTINPLKYLFLYGLTLHTYCKQMQICSVCWPAAVVLPLTCYQCASTEGKRCPASAKLFSSNLHDACITWRHGNGTILLQVRCYTECHF